MNNKFTCYKRFIAIMSIVLCFSLCGCSFSDFNSKEKEGISEAATTDSSALTERQKKILAEESLPTDIDKLNSNQKRGITNIEKAYLYLDDKYKGVEFEYDSHRPAAIMGKEETYFIPKGYDKNDNRNIVTVVKDRDGTYYDKNGYVLIIVRDTVEKVITDYLESYFGKGNVKVYVYPLSADMKYDDEINEKTVTDKVASQAVMFLSEEVCSPEKLDEFSEKYSNDGHAFECGFRATIVCQEDFNSLTYENHEDLYDKEHMIYDVNIN